MKYNPAIHKRRSIRLQGYDYSAPGAYFISICAYQRECLFGGILDGAMELNALGKIVVVEWLKSATIRQEIALDAWIVMPNHFHGIVVLRSPQGTTQSAFTSAIADPSSQTRSSQGITQSKFTSVIANPSSNNPQLITDGLGANNRSPLQGTPMKPRSLSSFVAGFKSATTKHINIFRNASGTPVWQRNYYEHIIRDEIALHNIRQYIQNNPQTWTENQLHPQNPTEW